MKRVTLFLNFSRFAGLVSGQLRTAGSTLTIYQRQLFNTSIHFSTSSVTPKNDDWYFRPRSHPLWGSHFDSFVIPRLTRHMNIHNSTPCFSRLGSFIQCEVQYTVTFMLDTYSTL